MTYQELIDELQTLPPSERHQTVRLHIYGSVDLGDFGGCIIVRKAYGCKAYEYSESCDTPVLHLADIEIDPWSPD